MPEREGSSVAYFRTADAFSRAQLLERKLEDLKLSTRTAMNQIEQILKQLESPLRMVEIMQEEVAELSRTGRAFVHREAQKALDLLDGDDMGAQEYADNVPEAVKILKGLL